MADAHWITQADALALVDRHDAAHRAQLVSLQAAHKEEYQQARHDFNKVHALNAKQRTHILALQAEIKGLERLKELESKIIPALHAEITQLDDRHNTLMRDVLSLKNPIQRFLRVRRSPVDPAQIVNADATQAITPDTVAFNTTLTRLVLQDTFTPYTFDRIFDSAADNHGVADIYKRLHISLERAREGNHVVIIAYGPSGAGKTTTLYDGLNNDASLLQRIVNHHIRDAHMGWGISMTWLEAHHNVSNRQNTLFDLLSPDKQKRKVEHFTHTSTSPPSDDVFMYTQSNDYLAISGTRPRTYLCPTSIKSVDHFTNLHQRAKRNRTIDRTVRNATSSRASTWLELRIQRRGELVGVITLVDTMGQEDAKDASLGQKKAAQAGSQTNNELGTMLSEIARTKAGKFQGRIKEVVVKQGLNKLLLPAFRRAVLRDNHDCHIVILGHVYDRSDYLHTRDTLETLRLWETCSKTLAPEG